MVLDSDVMSFSINSKNPEEIYSSACSGVYRSTNGLQTFARMRLLPNRFSIRTYTVNIDPVDTNTVYAGTVGGLWVSRSSGQNWSRLTPADITVNAIQVDPRNNQRILIGTEYQGVMLSEDGGRSWKESNQASFTNRVPGLCLIPKQQADLLPASSPAREGCIITAARTKRGNRRRSRREPEYLHS